MTIRFDLLIVVFVMSAILLLGMYLINVFFSDRYNTKFHKYDQQFKAIESAMMQKNYDQVIVLSDQIVRDEETGVNEIRAKAYIGLSKLATGKTADATDILNYLIGKYPGLKIVYEDYFRTYRKKEDLEVIYNNILTDYIPADREAVNEGMSLKNIFDAMDAVDWIMVVSIMTGSVTIYERLRKRRKNQTQNNL